MTKYSSAIVRLILATGLAAAVSACAPDAGKWRHPSIPPDQWSVDAAQCRYDAKQKAEDDMVRDGEVVVSSDSSESVDTLMNRAAFNKRAERLFAACMSDLGYVRAE